jgi:hypothetical protein
LKLAVQLYEKADSKNATACIALATGKLGAGNEARTRDLNLGKVALYQLSYSRSGKSAIIVGELWMSSLILPLQKTPVRQ